MRRQDRTVLTFCISFTFSNKFSVFRGRLPGMRLENTVEMALIRKAGEVCNLCKRVSVCIDEFNSFFNSQLSYVFTEREIIKML